MRNRMGFTKKNIRNNAVVDLTLNTIEIKNNDKTTL